MIRPKKIGFTYTDAFRDTFDRENELLIKEEHFPEVIFFGDSLIQYMPLKSEKLSFSWANRGIPGDVAFYMPHRFAADVLQLKPQAVVILCGINDIINCLLQEPPYEKQSIEQCVTTVFMAIVTMAFQAKEKGVAVYLLSILPIETPMGKNIDNNQAKIMIEDLNNRLLILAQQEQYHFMHCYEHFVDTQTGYLKRSDTVDGVHLKKAGYKKLFSILLPLLEKNSR